MAAEDRKRLRDAVGAGHDAVDRDWAGRRCRRARPGRGGPSWLAMSSRTCGVAVAVKAWRLARGKPLPQQGQLAVLRPEVVAPLADAVGLVDREPLHAHAGQRVEQPGVHEPLGRGEQQPQLARHGAGRGSPPALRARAPNGGPRPDSRSPRGRRPDPSSGPPAARSRRRSCRPRAAAAGSRGSCRPPVGITTSESRPASAASIASAWSGRSVSKPHQRRSIVGLSGPLARPVGAPPRIVFAPSLARSYSPSFRRRGQDTRAAKPAAAVHSRHALDRLEDAGRQPGQIPGHRLRRGLRRRADRPAGLDLLRPDVAHGQPDPRRRGAGHLGDGSGTSSSWTTSSRWPTRSCFGSRACPAWSGRCGSTRASAGPGCRRAPTSR